jgi:hypothetical protein
LPYREDMIEKTTPELGFGEDLAKRIHYTLLPENQTKTIEGMRIVRLLSNLVAALHHKGLLTEKDVEDLLIDQVS